MPGSPLIKESESAITEFMDKDLFTVMKRKEDKKNRIIDLVCSFL